jgi:uncharacterized protein (DUF1800 family)
MQKPRIFSSAIAGLLCVLLTGQPFLSAQQPNLAPAAKIPARPTPGSRLTQDQRILHLLNRLTFGPTPESIAEVASLGPNGIDRWFDQQLHPERLPNGPLNARLAQYPAMQLPVDQLMVSFPGNPQIRQVINGKLPIPDEPAFAAIYRRNIAVYQDKQQKKAEAKKQAGAENATPDKAALDKMGPEKGNPEKASQDKSDPAKSENSALTSIAPALPADIKAETPISSARPGYGELLVTSTLALPPDQRTNRILSMQPAAYEEFRSNLKGRRPKLIDDLDPAQRELLADFDNPQRAVIDELDAQRLLRDIYSSSQLAEVMITFWLNHFNVFLHKNEETPYYLVSYERDVIRPYALGNFEELLDAVAQSTAMMLYLDNSSSTGPNSVTAERQRQRAASGKPGKNAPQGINENYARELMELHTLGVNGGYTQKDVTEVAKVFTGWTVDHPAEGGYFKFDANRHEPGNKLVLGHKIKDKGQQEGFEVLHLLATSPATAHFLSKKLAIAFVSDNPPASLIDRMAASFLKSKGDIPAVLRTMLHSPEFWSPEAYQAKVKTPLEYVVSAARASGADVANTQPLVQALNQMGMPLYSCVPPTGYADTQDAWVSTGALVARMNFSLSLAGNKFPGITAKWPQTAPPTVLGSDSHPVAIDLTTPAARELELESQLIPTGVSDKTKSTVSEQVAAQAKSTPPEKQFALSAGLLLGSPEFQRR